MALSGFNATPVLPGDPLTAQAWNDIIDALGEVYAELASRRAAGVRVTNPELDPRKVRVVARHVSLPPVEAVRPSGAVEEHVLVGIRPGTWTVHAEAEGYTTAQTDLVVPEVGDMATLQIALVQHGAFMPRLFGRPLREALAALSERGIAVEHVFDVTGASFVPEDANKEMGESPVMFQSPPAGTPVPPEMRVGLAVGARIEPQPSVVVPSLVGMTYKEAERALEALGLVVGRQDNRTGGDNA